MQIIRLPEQNADSIVCIIDSYSATAVQSHADFYDLQWNKLPAEGRMPDITKSELLVKPDTMSISEFQELSSWISPELVEMNYNIETNEIEVSLSIPFVFAEEDKSNKLSDILSKQKLIWDGYSFKKCY